jgi:ribonuclease D
VEIAADLKPIWVNSSGGFESMLTALLNESVVGVDTESNSLHAYRERVCLIQFSTPQQNFLLDTLAGLDVHPLGDLFNAARITKIFHAAEYDVICLRRDFDFDFQSIFDTMQAARILGKEKFSLGDMVESEFGRHLDKHNQKADWAVRPLTPSMQQYASLDTQYLIALHERLEQELSRRGLRALAEEDFRRLCQSAANENHRPLYTQVSGYQLLNSRQLAVLNELCHYRDQNARRSDLPLFKILPNSALLEIARLCPLSEQELKKVDALPLRLFERHKAGLLSSVHSGMNAPPINLPVRQRPDSRIIERLERLKTWRKKKADEMKVLSDIVLPRDILEEITSQNPQEIGDLKRNMASVPWRMERFAAEILQVIQEKK